MYLILTLHNILTPPNTPANREEDQAEQDFNDAVENEFIQKYFTLDF